VGHGGKAAHPGAGKLTSGSGAHVWLIWELRTSFWINFLATNNESPGGEENTMRWLITGGAGFVGSHLAEFLIAQGDEVHIIDDLSTGSARNVHSIRSHRRFRMVVDTITNVPVVTELVDLADCVVHLAAAVGVRLIIESPVRTIELNVHGTEVVLQAAAKKGKRTLVASTSEVYGKSHQVPFHEDQDLVLGPSVKGRWSYAASKLIDEFLALAYWKEKKLPATVIRFFNTVGPRQTGRYGMVIPTFVRQALAGQPISVYGTGEQTRCFCHVEDVVRAIHGLCLSEGAVGQVVNVGSQEEVSIRALAARVRKLTGSPSMIHTVSYDQAYEEGFEDMTRRVPDIGKAQRLLDWCPTKTLDDIVRDVIAFERRSNERPTGVSTVGDTALNATC
jgi:UDP-glucose 4-epimerase